MTIASIIQAPYRSVQDAFAGGFARGQLAGVFKVIGLPVVGMAVFLLLWQLAANNIVTSLGNFPGPGEVVTQFNNLIAEHKEERQKVKDKYERQKKRNEKKLAKNPDAKVKWREYKSRITFFDQIGTSLITVICGFLVASLLAIPLGFLIGLSANTYSAVNPIIQVLKPVSPLAWLPLVTMVVSALYTSVDPTISKAFLVSMFTVSLCCLWPTVINTAFGVVNVSKDLVNVSKVLRLNWLSHSIKIVMPSSVPMILTGLRLSIGIAWMVLIAAEMLAQNPGLGKFVWDEFQNGSSNSLARIMAAILVIGFIGFLLDFLLMSFTKYSVKTFSLLIGFLSILWGIATITHTGLFLILVYGFSLIGIYRCSSVKVDYAVIILNAICLVFGFIGLLAIFLGLANATFSPMQVALVMVGVSMSLVIGPIYNILMVKEKVV